MRLKNKSALVTGGRQGIGLGIVQAFIAEGADVTTCGRGPRIRPWKPFRAAPHRPAAELRMGAGRCL